MRIKIASWNVNSVRIRLESVARFVHEFAPDVLCLQEIKVTADRFPGDFFRELGFGEVAVNGNRHYHGVAVLSRLPLAGVTHRAWCGKADGRHLQVELPGGIELHNFYVPSGGDIPDPEQNDKFAHKLDFLAEMAEWFADRARPDARRVMLGDLNVAPLEVDVWSHKQLLNVVSHTPVEVEALGRVQASHDWVDGVRHFIPPPERLYSWWSYRARDWQASDRGRRLDHVWVTPALVPALAAAEIAKAARGWERPSDHAPVLVTLDV